MTVEERLLDAGYEGAVILDGYDEAFIGVSHEGRAVYDAELMVQVLMDRDGMTREEAVEWIDYNDVRALPYAGENSPVIVFSLLD